MSKEIAAVTFDYDGLEGDDKGKLIYLAGEINKVKRQHAKSGMEIGKAIADAHELLAGVGREGQFSAWVETQCGYKRTTAYNLMWTWQKFGKCSTVEHFDDSALYLLAAPKAPEPAVTEALKLAGKGQHIDKETAKEILDKFREASTRASGGGKPTPPKPAPPPPKPAEAEPAAEPDPDSFDTETLEAAAPKVMADLQKPYDDILNHVTQAKKLWNQIVGDERDGVYAAAKRQRVLTMLDELYAPVAQCRPMKECTFCEGKGCKKCSNCGWWPRSVVEGMSR